MASEFTLRLGAQSGYFDGADAVQKAESYVQHFEEETNGRYVKVKSDHFKTISRVELPVKVFWEENSSQSLPIPYDGVPFVIVGRQVRECCHGPDRHRSRFEKKKPTEHSYSNKGRTQIKSKKINCPATVYLRYVIRFPDYKIHSNSSYQRKKHGQLLKRDMEHNLVGNLFHRVYVSCPPDEIHQFHLMGEIATMSYRLDKAVIGKIHSLVSEGVRNVSEMSRHIEMFSKANFPTASHLSNQFFPTKRDIRNHMYRALGNEQYSTEDQENLLRLVQQWKAERPKDRIYFIPSPSEESDNDQDVIEDFLFVHQNEDQKRLLNRYGNEICLLDATYSTSKYELPLFFVCVNTNVGFSVVASFIVSSEATENIRRGLSVIKDWNPAWSPKYFITDFDRKEIQAVESTFEGCFTYLCDFHREQAWKRWVGPSNGIDSVESKQILALMRSVANANNSDAYAVAVESLKESNTWKQNTRFRTWFEKQWLSNAERWVQFHRQRLFNIRINTTNGLERQHQDFKRNYLAYYTQGSLSSMVTTLVTKFLPDSYKRYVQYNAKGRDYKYTADQPHFLRYKPRMLIDHCMKRLPTTYPTLSAITSTGPKTFHVTSQDSGRQYHVDLGSALPCCSCEDWLKTHLPCKHMLHIILHVPGQGWSTLSDEFTGSPHFSLDEDIFVFSDSRNLTFSNETGSEPPTATRNCEQIRSVEKNPSQSKLVTKNPKTINIESKCKMLTSRINNYMYLLRNSSDYEDVHQDLVKLHKKLLSKIPSKSGLLLRKPTLGRRPLRYQHGQLKLRKTKRRKAMIRKKTDTRLPSMKPPVGRNLVVPIDTCITIDEPDGQVEVGANEQDPTDDSSTRDCDLEQNQGCRNSPDTDCAPEQNPTDGQVEEGAHEQDPTDDSSTRNCDLEQNQGCRNSPDTDCVPEQNPTVDFEELFRNDTADNTPILKIGPHVLTRDSFVTLRSTLADEVIDGYMTLLLKDRSDVLYIDTVQGTSIFKGNPETVMLLESVSSIDEYTCCMAVVNEGSHWVLIVVMPREKSLIYLNPLGEIPAVIDEYFQKWYFFLHQRYRNGLEPSQPGSWNIVSKKHAKQRDSISCGVFTLMFAEKYLKGESLTFPCSKHYLTQYQKAIGRRLVTEGTSYRQAALISSVQKKVNTDSTSVKRKKDMNNSTKTPVKKQKTYCVCGQQDDKRLYWECTSCKKWYHPDCIGRDPKEKIHKKKFSCPTCSKKEQTYVSDAIDIPSLWEVEEVLRREIEILEADIRDDDLFSELECHGATPVFYNNVSVRLFCDLKNNCYPIKETGGGPFVIIPNEAFSDYLNIRDDFNTADLFILDLPLKYFLSQCKKSFKVKHVTQNVVELYPLDVIEDYKDWLVNMHEQIK